ncbi:MAG: vWA domain-containing protein [Phycisphaerales bacterium]
MSLLGSTSWARQAIACLRLERFTCDDSLLRIRALVRSPSWRLRCFAIRSLAARHAPPPEDWLATQDDPRVVRTALRCGWAIDPGRMRAGYDRLSKSASLDDRMLAVEIAAELDEPKLQKEAVDLLATVVSRMSRVEAGVLSGRIAAVTGAPDFGRDYRWRDWMQRNRHGLALRRVRPLDDDRDASDAIARLEPAHFIALVGHLDELGARDLDVAIAIDCTASMFGELADAQGGVDNLIAFVGAVSRSVRFGLVAYRDRRDRDFETRGWDFTESIDEARTRLWSLSAEGGGDDPESVHPALKLAYTKLSWRFDDPDRRRVLVLVGDAPPHPGTRSFCADLARQGAAAKLVTHVIQARRRSRDGQPPKDVEGFPEIAAAGGGRCVTLDQDATLTIEIAGLAVGDDFAPSMKHFFRQFLVLCR